VFGPALYKCIYMTIQRDIFTLNKLKLSHKYLTQHMNLN
jgi:hypothetical protein